MSKAQNKDWMREKEFAGEAKDKRVGKRLLRQ